MRWFLEWILALLTRADRAVAGILFRHLDARPGGGVVLADQEADSAPPDRTAGMDILLVIERSRHAAALV